MPNDYILAGTARGENYKPNDTVLTPEHLFKALNLEFDLDPAHPPFKTHVPCKKYYTEQDDGLAQEWEGLVWLNPPFSKPTPWVQKFIIHSNGIMIAPLSKSLWSESLWRHSDSIMQLSPRFKFVKTDGKNFHHFQPIGLFAIGEIATQALHNSGLGKVR
jgi:hypothetical protein